MDDQELNAFINRKLADTLNRSGGDLSTARQENMDRYLGEPYGTEIDGQSKITTMEVFEAVEWTMPSLMRVLGNANSVKFQPEGQEDQDAAEQETAVIRHLLFDQENGFLAFHNWAKDTLMSPVGYAKIWIDEVQEVFTERYRGLGEQELAQLVADDNVEVVGHAANTALVMTPQGPMPVTTYDVEIKTTRGKKKLRFEAVPGNEVLVDRDLRSIDLDDADFVAHKTRRSFTDLVNDGYDRKKLEAVGDSEEMSYGDEETNRFFYDDESGGSDSENDQSMRSFTVFECFVRVDSDGDGLAERRKVVKIGNTIFENEELDYIPLVGMTSILMPHKHSGVEWVHAVKNLQEASTALFRQLLTNLYRINVPKKYVGEDFLIPGETLDYLQDASAEIIPVRNPTAMQIEQPVPMAQHILPVMQQVRDQQNIRTGVNPSISLDPKVLQQSTEGAFTSALGHAAQRIELLVRVMAETGVKQALRKAHRLVREHFGDSVAVELHGQWVNVKPTEWRERTNLKVTVGIGNQNQTERLQGLASILTMQKEAMAVGMAEPKHIYHTMDQMTEAAGFGSAAAFFKNPSVEQVQAPPDPMSKAAEMQGQALMLDGQSKMLRAQVEQQKAQLEREKAMLEAQMSQREAELNARMKAFEAQRAAGVAQVEAQHTMADTDLKRAQTIKTLADSRAVQANAAMDASNHLTEQAQA